MSTVVGHTVVRGARIPLSELATKLVIEITESTEVGNLFELTERAVFGLTKAVSETLQTPSESVVFGLTTFQSEDLQNNLSESVTITNV